jgi:hypothetical protein
MDRPHPALGHYDQMQKRSPRTAKRVYDSVMGTQTSGESICPVCGDPHPYGAESVESCPALREAAAAGSQPKGVPLRVYAAYLEARAALRANAPAAATRVLQGLLSHIAEERGMPPELSFPTKMHQLCDHGVISHRMQTALLEHALSASEEAERAWALLSIAEHAFYRLYLSALRPSADGRASPSASAPTSVSR